MPDPSAEPKCCMKIMRGSACHNVALSDLPCCFDHVGHWANEHDRNLLALLRLRAHTVTDVRRSVVAALVAIRMRKELSRKGRPVRTTLTYVYFDLDKVPVVADYLASLGNAEAAEKLLRIY